MATVALLGCLPGGVGTSMAAAQQRGAHNANGAQATPQPNGDWQPDPEEQWLFELRSTRYRVGDGIRGYVSGRHVCVNFSDIVLALDLPIRVDTQLRRATGWAFDERRVFVIDRDAARVTLASRSQSLDSGVIIDTPEGWCVDPAQLGQWLGVTLRADTANSVLFLESETPLPFELAAQRRQRADAARPETPFSLADLPQARRPYAIWQTPSVDVVASTSLLRDARNGRTTAQARYELFASGELLGASVDARLSSDNAGVPQSLRLRAYRSDPNGQLLGPLNATHVAAGDVTSLSSPIAAQAISGRGVVVSNRPLDLPDRFDRMTFRGDLPDGWDAELYRNGQLLGFAMPGPDGRYEFVDVALNYGLNRFEVVLYGPQGQVRREVRTIPVGMDAIPPQKTYYWAGVVQEDQDLLELFGNRPRPYRRGWRGMVGIERGLNRRTSLGAWATSMVIENRRYTIAEASLRRSIGPTLAELTGSAQSGGGKAARLLWVGQFGNSFFQLESTLANGGYRSDRVGLGVVGFHSLSFDHNLSLGMTTLPVHLEARYRQRRDGQNRLESTGRVSANFRKLSFTGQVDWAHTSVTGQFARPADEITTSLLANARFGRVRVRGEARVSISGPTASNDVTAVAEWAQSERSDWRLELGYQSVSHRTRAGVGYSRRFDRLSLSATAEAGSDGSVAAGLSLSFGFGPDPRGHGIRFSRDRIASQGQALATVFMDDNGDGRRQDGEELAEGVVITAGNATADTPTDSGGQAIVDSLAPFRPILIGIDESSIPNPLIRPALSGVVVTPRPGVATHIMLPLVAAGEIDGMLMRAGGNGIEGAELELVDQSGAVRARTRSEFDGFFIFESVPYGKFTLRMAALSAQVIGIEARLAEVELNRTNQRIRLGPLSVNARANLARGPPPQPSGQMGDAANVVTGESATSEGAQRGVGR
ncbi:MAG: carboxypeptidase-like regulatory domain-containing protein [Sphingopyxis sp.]